MRIPGFMLTVVVVLATLVERTDQWGDRFRKYMISEAKKSIWGDAAWEKPGRWS